MVAISEHTLAAITFSIMYQSPLASHEDRVHGHKVNFWRDIFPAKLRSLLMGSRAGDVLEYTLSANKVGGEYDPGLEQTVERRRFRRKRVGQEVLEPRFGRFYPQGMIMGLPGVHRDTLTPFRCTGVDDSSLIVNTNHPLVEVGRDLRYRASVEEVWPKEQDGGGRLNDWQERMCCDGQGMQMRFRGRPTEFFTESTFTRQDTAPDQEFYKGVRITEHVDAACNEPLAAYHGRVLEPGMKVLDLMSSCSSHLPQGLELELSGLGLNREEMDANPALVQIAVRDLNQTPELPYADNSFDAVICALSIEYLVDPVAVLREVSRVLVPGGRCHLSFSNRWFPTKAIHLWAQLHEFERMGFVLDLMERSRGFTDLHTLSERGWPRSWDDPHFPALRMMDPLYVVRGAAL